MAIVKAAIATLDRIPRAEAMHISLAAGSTGKRSAGLAFMAFHAGQHPFRLDEEGLHVRQHGVVCGRSSGELLADALLTYISWHAMARLHERDYRLTAGAAFNVFGFLGVLGLMTRYSDKHTRGGMCLHYRDVLAVGSLKHAVAPTSTGQKVDGTFYDVRTVLPADEVKDAALLEQGKAANMAIAAWLKDRTATNADTLAMSIPFLPRREDDFTLKMAAGV